MRIMVKASSGKKRDPISKRAGEKRTVGMVQVVGYLPSKHKVLSSNSSTTEDGRLK
jgi:hypothetical protein